MRKGLVFLSIIFVCGWVVLSGHSEEEGTTSISSDSSPGKPVKPVEQSAVNPLNNRKENPMVATVNGTGISRAEVERGMKNFMLQFEGNIPPEQMDKIRPKLWKQTLENLIDQRLLLEEADKEGIKLDKKSVDEEIAKITGSYPTPEDFQKQLTMLGISKEKLRQEVRQNLEIKTLLDRQTATVKDVNDKEVEAFYRDNPESFHIPERVKASHILIAVLPDDSPEKREKKRQELSRLREKIKKGADFAQMAREHSDGPSKSRGGDLGYFERGKMVKPFEDVAFRMKVGEVSEIVETQFGYHLIKLTDHKDAQVIPLEKVRDKVAAFLNRQKKEQVASNYLLKLRSAADIKYLDK